MPEETRTIYSFDGFVVDLNRRVLLRDGQPIQLTSKAFDLLLALVESQGRELGKEELMERVWANQIVEDANLTVTMANLRKALGEKASDHRFIVTIPGKGYRFVAELGNRDLRREFIVESKTEGLITVEEDVVGDEPQGKLVGAQFTKVKGRVWLGAVALFVVLAISVAGYFTWFSRATVASPQIKSIAVLPFKPLVADSRDESLELGMADTLIARLSNIREINVRPISSVRKYSALEQDPIAAGREQRVDAVLDGQIQKAGEKVRVTVRLLRIADGAPLWSSQFDEKMTDIFAVQDSISERVTSALALTLTNEEKSGIAKRYTTNTEAYELYLKGRYQLNRLTDDGFFKGRAFFQQAIDKDPGYAMAYAGLADAYDRLGGFDALAPKEAFPQAREAAQKALQLDASLAEAHTALATVNFAYDWDFSAAAREYQRAIEINPGYSDAHQMNSYYLAAIGRFNDALAEMKRALELDPVSLEKTTGIGEILYQQRHYDEAIGQYRKALEMDSNSGFTHWALGRALLAQGKFNEAIAEFQKAIPLSGDSPDEPAELARAYALAGRRDEALKIIGELNKLSEHKHVSPTGIAATYGALGDKNQAFAFLNKAFDERDFVLIMLKVEPMLDPLRSDPRFAELVRRIGLPE
ncbi:MAG TPA: winged helix-turn-helix domain-containing protein [Pyrinomonadaceae bacterium]|jgi:serine/threonine-protein kinase|nr:winged helix-turn-helix domain-containing protein [Pyrinomonadaceae bacterium]